jgi:murein DD-endopeptidase MepM/ murein hydrolase activator NlpD
MVRRDYGRSTVMMLSALALLVATLVGSSGSAVASVSSDQTGIAQLEQQIAAQGEHAQSLVSRYNEVQAQVDALDAQIGHDQRTVAADQAVEGATLGRLRRLAVKAYVSGAAMDSPAMEMFSGTSNIQTLLEQNHYLGSVGNKWDTALTTLQLDRARTEEAQGSLRSKQSEAKTTLGQLTAAHDAATAAIAADEAKLTRINGNLRSLLAAAQAQHRAEEAAAERALAAAVQPRSPAPFVPPAVNTPAIAVVPPPAAPSQSSSPPSSSGAYANPLRDITALTSERIDQGVDYAGFGPIYAIGNGVVVNTVGSGWPGGTFIAYRLSDGPASGLVVFAAEDIEPNVQVGATVTASTVIGHMYAGPDGIETGWANGSRLPDTMARTYGQFNGSNSSAFGYNFSQLLQSVGAPGGVSNGPPSGQLPASWPRW